MGRVAAPAVVMQSLSSFMSLGLNQLLTRWSESAVFVLGVYFKIQSFVFMPIFGVNSGLIPILSYNYGSGALRRVSASVRFGQQFTAVLSLSGALLLSLLASPCSRSAFRASPEALAAMGGPRSADHRPLLFLRRDQHYLLLRLSIPGPQPLVSSGGPAAPDPAPAPPPLPFCWP